MKLQTRLPAFGLMMALLLTAGCGPEKLEVADSGSESAAPSVPPKPDVMPLEDFTLCWLRTGPQSATLGKEEQQELFTGHFANMKTLAEKGTLLLAGPYGAAPSKDAPFRGLYIFDEKDLSTAKRIARRDPCVKAGIFRSDILKFRSVPSLRALNAWHKEGAGGDETPGAYCRAYVLVEATITSDGATHRLFGKGLAGLERLWQEGKILCFGRYSRDDKDGVLLVLNQTKVDNARALVERLAEPGTLIDPVFHPWFASEAMALIPEAINASF